MRLGIGLSLSSIGLSSPGSILSIMGTSVVALWDAASLTASPVASWPDSSGNGFALTQGTGAKQPTWSATGGPNSQPSVLFDGGDDLLINLAMDRPAPGTEPSFYWTVLRQVTWTNNDNLFSFGASGLILFQRTASPGISQFNTSAVNLDNNLTVNTYKRIEAYFSNSTADYIKIGAAAATTGASAGNTDPGANFVMGAGSAASGWANIEICIFAIFRVNPSTAQKAALDAYVTSRFGAGLV